MSTEIKIGDEWKDVTEYRVVSDPPMRYRCRRCGATRLSWEIFEARGRLYCLGHIPWWVRLSMRLRGVK